MTKYQLKVPKEYVLTAILSSSLTIVCSIIYIVLCTLTLIYRYDCSAANIGDADGSQYFLTTLTRVYILDVECVNSLPYSGLTQSFSVFVLVTIILSFAVVSLCAAIALLIVACREEAAEQLNVYVYIYAAVCVASLVIDLTLGIHFGIDHGTLKDELALSSAGLGMNYEKDVLRLGALLLMAVTLKGFVILAVNLVLLVLLLVYAVDYHKKLKQNEHSIHNMGVIDAFQRPKRQEDPWQLQNNDMYFTRGSQMNHGYHHEEDTHRPPHARDTMPDNTSNRHQNRSEAWLHGQPSPGGMGSRPFSYLEEPKRPVPVKPPTTPTHHPNEPHWRRDWPPPPNVPDPDYSPPQRRLKSALKTGYP